MAVVQPSGYTWYMYRFADGSGVADNVDGTVSEEFFGGENSIPGEVEPAMYLDGVDQSDAFAQCVAQSGYSYLAATNNEKPPISADDMQAQVDANNQWAECVREHGFPDVADTSVPPDAGQYVWYPRVALPLSMIAKIYEQ